MALTLPLDLDPMEAAPVTELPAGRCWLYEPRYAGLRCLAFREDGAVRLHAGDHEPLDRRFPEIVAGLLALPAARFVLDGWIILRDAPPETLRMRLGAPPARIAALVRSHPATFVAFDLLLDADGRRLTAHPFAERRAALEILVGASGRRHRGLIVAKATRSRRTAVKWLGAVGHRLDGAVARRLDLPYRPGRRAAAGPRPSPIVVCSAGDAARRQAAARG